MRSALPASVTLALVLGVTNSGHTSYHETFLRDLGEFAFVGSIFDNDGEPGGTPLEVQRKNLEATVARGQAAWRAGFVRFRTGKHHFQRTATLARPRYERKNPNQICVYLPTSAAELCFTSRIPVDKGGILSLRFAIGFRQAVDGPTKDFSLRFLIASPQGLSIARMSGMTSDIPAAELEAELTKARARQFQQEHRWSVPFMLLHLAGEHDRALDEALASYAGWMQKKGDALLNATTEADRDLNRAQMAATTLTMHVRELLSTMPDAKVARMATRAHQALAAIASPHLDGIRAEVTTFRAELAAAGL